MKNKINVNTVKNQNRLLILDEIINNMQVTRTEIGRKLELSNATVGTIADEFIEIGIIYEEKVKNNSVGRKPSYLKLNTDSGLILVIDLVSNNMTYSVLNLDLSIIQNYHYTFDTQLDYEKNLDKFLEETKSYINQNQIDNKIIGISIAIAGTYNETTDYTICSILPSLTKIKLIKKLRNYFTQKIFIENDMRLVSIYDIQRVKNYNMKSIFFMCLSTGIGGALSINGKLYRGKNNLAGEIGQTMVTSSKNLEQSISWGNFVSTLIKNNNLVNDRNIKEYILNEYTHGKPLKKEMDEILSYLVQALTNIIWILNPDTIVINEQYDSLDSFFIGVILNMLKENLLPEVLNDLEIILLPNKEESMVLGAAHFIRSKWTKQLSSSMNGF